MTWFCPIVRSDVKAKKRNNLISMGSRFQQRHAYLAVIAYLTDFAYLTGSAYLTDFVYSVFFSLQCLLNWLCLLYWLCFLCFICPTMLSWLHLHRCLHLPWLLRLAKLSSLISTDARSVALLKIKTLIQFTVVHFSENGNKNLAKGKTWIRFSI